MIGVTGSAGKTTTKDAIAHLFRPACQSRRQSGNFNNHVGVPLSLLRIPGRRARIAVIEIGMNHAGEIRELSEIAKPDIGVVTNVGYAHVENFEIGIEGVAAAKRELIEALPATGTAVLNADDPRVAAMARGPQRPRGHLRNFATGRCTRRGRRVPARPGSRFRVNGTDFESGVDGRHGVFEFVMRYRGRRTVWNRSRATQGCGPHIQARHDAGSTLHSRRNLVYNDCYNSNPDAVRAMIDVLRDTPARRRIAVLGEMLELGRWAEPLHREIGNYVAVSGISVLVGIRGVARKMVDAAIEGGLPKDAAFFFEDPGCAGEFLKTFAREGDAILFKGSRGTQVERALHTFLPGADVRD